MSSFEFYGPEKYASCQYFADEFFVVLQDDKGEYPMLRRAQTAFEALHDDVYSFEDGEAMALSQEVGQIIRILNLDLRSPLKKYAVFCQIAQELDAVFAESETKKTDINFRWG